MDFEILFGEVDTEFLSGCSGGGIFSNLENHLSYFSGVVARGGGLGPYAEDAPPRDDYDIQNHYWPLNCHLIAI